MPVTCHIHPIRPWQPALFALWSLMGCADCPDCTPSPTPQDPYADAYVHYSPGAGGGFGSDLLPSIVLGPPQGGGLSSGSVDVLSLGVAGEITLVFEGCFPVDQEGPDLVVFENPFSYGTGVYVEPGQVSVSQDGQTWVSFPCDASPPYSGCAGLEPVYASESAGISALDPAVSGGDLFDLALVGMTSVQQVRIRDLGMGAAVEPTAGFDLDAIAALHCE